MIGGELRIVHAVRSTAFAGVERYVATLARTQAALGHRVVVVGGDGARMGAELDGVPWRPGATTADVARGVWRWRSADVVHAHMTAAETAVVALGPALPAPLVVTRHFADPRGSSVPGRVAARAIRGRVARQIAISAFVADRVDGASVVVHPGSADARPRTGERERVVLMAQRLEREKRADVGLQIWAASGLAAHGWRLDVAGDGALRAELEAQAASLGVTHSVRFLGSVDDVADRMGRAAVFLAPRPDEPYGLSVVEAMAAGTPVLAAAGGGHDETVGSVTRRYLVDAAEPDAAGAALRDLALDDVGRAAYGARLHAAHRAAFTLPVTTRAVLEQYRLALEPEGESHGRG